MPGWRTYDDETFWKTEHSDDNEPGYAYETRIDQYTEGTLNIDVADVAQRKLVWEGSVVGRITDEFVRNLESGLDEAVQAIFVNYPVESIYKVKD